MSVAVRAMTALTGNNNNFTTQSSDGCIIVAVNGYVGTVPTVRWGGSSGTAMTLIARGWTGDGNLMCGLWYLNRPAIGTYQLYSSHVSCDGQVVAFITGAIVDLVGDTSTDSHNNNDYLTVPISSEASATVFYAGVKTGGGTFTTGETSSGLVNGLRMAYETGAADSSATYGSGGDAHIVLVGGSLRFFGGGFLPRTLRILNRDMSFIKHGSAVFSNPTPPWEMYANPVVFLQPYQGIAGGSLKMTQAELAARVMAGMTINIRNQDGSIPRDNTSTQVKTLDNAIVVVQTVKGNITNIKTPTAKPIRAYD